MEGRIVDAMRRVASTCPDVTWVWAPDAQPFYLAAYDGREWSDATTTLPLSTRTIRGTCFELAARALLCNLIVDVPTVRGLPPDSPILVLGDVVDRAALERVRRWRALQASRLMFVGIWREMAAQRGAWAALGCDGPGVHLWTGDELLPQA